MRQSAIDESKANAVNRQRFSAMVAFCTVTGFTFLSMFSSAEAGGMMRAPGMRMVHVAPAPMHHSHRAVHHIRHVGVHPGHHRPVMHRPQPQVHFIRHSAHHVHSGHPVRHMGHIQHQRPLIHQPFPRHGVAHVPAYFHPATQQGGGGLGLCCNQGIVVQPIVFPQGMGGGHHTPFIPKVDIPAPKVHRPFS